MEGDRTKQKSVGCSGCQCQCCSTPESLRRSRKKHHQRKRNNASKVREERSSQLQAVGASQGSAKSSEKVISCNLDRFLESTCPAVQAQHLAKNCQWEGCRKRQQDGHAEPLPYFTLGDLWDSLHEWSAYGAGVPITLHGQEIVVQYYVPYLSALQLYTRSKKRPNLRFRDGEISDPSDFDERDSASDAATDSECDGVPDCLNCQCGDTGRADAVTYCECEKFKRVCDAWAGSEEEENCQESSSRDWQGHLLFEYFELSPPHARVPLSDKISQLGARMLELRSLRSVDLLPASWMSIAWYPIYRIPTGPTLRDLEACFLTFHCLSTSLHDGELSGIVKPTSRPRACAVTLSSHSHENDDDDPTIHLEAFGLAHYKLRGSIWTSAGNPERRHAASLYRCSESWLKRLHIQHPDFDFFRLHNPT